jgi:hypothetical protein
VAAPAARSWRIYRPLACYDAQSYLAASLLDPVKLTGLDKSEYPKK